MECANGNLILFLAASLLRLTLALPSVYKRIEHLMLFAVSNTLANPRANKLEAPV